MNVVVKVKDVSDAASIAHSIMAYDRLTDRLISELPVPMFLDTLTLKIAKVPVEDRHGAASYVLLPKAVEIFGFLLGLKVDFQGTDYFIEATLGNTSRFSPAKLEAVAMLAKLSPPATRESRLQATRVSESELVFPTLRLLEAEESGWMSIGAVAERLAEMFAPTERDAQTLKDRSDTYFQEKMRAMLSHRAEPENFIGRGLAEYDAARHGLRISGIGRATVQALRS